LTIDGETTSAPAGTASEGLAAAHRALASGEWERAKTLFEGALAVEESAQAREGLGWAAWWLADDGLTFSAREAAYRLYKAAGDHNGAGRLAAWIASDHLEYRGDEAVARGWLTQAHRLLDDLPESADHGWLALLEVSFALNIDLDTERALALSRRGADLGRRLGVADLEAIGAAQEAQALMLEGSMDDGSRRLDEASALAAGEDFHLPVSSGWTLCCVISACDGIGDFRRAAQWCEVTRRNTERWGGRQLLGVCRTTYGRVLATSGDWSAAEQELTAAVEDFAASRPGMASAGLLRLGELRARQGRVDDARELFERAGLRGIVGLGELALADGEPTEAAEAAERVLRRMPGDVNAQRLPALELLARARCRLGHREAAAEAAAEVDRVAIAIATPFFRGKARLLAAELANSDPDPGAAREAAEDAIDCFEESAAPYEAALARIELAAALEALDRREGAERESRAAQRAFTALGAVRELGPGERSAVEGKALGELTPRELEVLKLVAAGMSDATIAERLTLSPHTVHRHVANVRVKLSLSSRAAAVAYAARAGLL